MDNIDIMNQITVLKNIYIALNKRDYDEARRLTAEGTEKLYELLGKRTYVDWMNEEQQVMSFLEEQTIDD